MNVLTSCYIKDNEQEEYRNPWTLYKSWSDFDIRNNGRWGRRIIHIPVLSYVYVVEGVFNEKDTIQFPAPVYTTNTDFFSMFEFYYYSKKVEKENLIVFTSIAFKNDYTGKLTFYLHSDYKGVNTIDKYILKPISAQFEIPVIVSLVNDKYIQSSYILPIEINCNLTKAGIREVLSTADLTLPIELDCNLTKAGIRPVNTTADLTLPIQIESKVCGVWAYYDTWEDLEYWSC